MMPFCLLLLVEGLALGLLLRRPLVAFAEV